MHIGVEHFLFNMLALYFTEGKWLSRFLRTLRFLELYLLAGVMGMPLPYFLRPNVIAAGASTSLFWAFAAICDSWLL